LIATVVSYGDVSCMPHVIERFKKMPQPDC
jgi:hypothetical protein